MYLVQERPVDNPMRREITKTTSLGKAFISEMKCIRNICISEIKCIINIFISEMKCIRNIRISAMKCSFHCNEMFSSLKWNALLSEMTSPRNARISEMKWKEPAGGWKTQKSEKNYTVILFTVCHSVVSFVGLDGSFRVFSKWIWCCLCFCFFCLCLVVTLSAILWSFLWCPSRLDAFSWLGLTWDG